MSRRIKLGLLIMISIAIVAFTIIGLGRDIFHAIEEIFYDRQATIWTNNAFSRFTNKVVMFVAILSFFLIPFYLTKLIEPEYELPKIIFKLKFIGATLLIVVVILVVLVFFPASCVVQGFAEGFHSVFLGDCLYSHVLIPFLFVVSFFTLDDRQKLNGKEHVIITSIVTAYIVIYTFFVFIIKTWIDFYYISELIKYISFFGLVPLTILIIFGIYLGARFLVKLLNNEK